MSIQRIPIEASIADVFSLLLDPYTYPKWLVGANRIRSVDDEWPAPGSAFHHVVGFGPIKVADSTRVISAQEPTELVLDVRARPFGRARATFTLRSIDADRTELSLEETPTSPLLRLCAPLLQMGIAMRNDASIKRLRDLVVDPVRRASIARR